MQILVAAILLLMVVGLVGRILKIGCSIIGSLLYLGLLFLALAILWGFIKMTGYTLPF